jgi:hypothetical protein
LTGGTFNVGGTLEFTGADIVTNASNLTLTGTSYSIVNQSGTNALAGFDDNAKTGVLTLASDADFTAPGNFTNAGAFTIDKGSTFTVNSSSKLTNSGSLTVDAGGTADVAGTLTNFNSTTNTLKGGTYVVGGTLEFAGANIVTNEASLTLTGTSGKIVNSTTSANGLANFATNATGGTFSLKSGSTFTTAGNFSNAGTVSVNTGTSLTIGGTGVFTQTAGKTTDNGTLTDSGGLSLTAGSLFGTGTINGTVTSSGIVNPGSATATGVLTDNGAYTQSSTGALDIAVGGSSTGKFDVLNSTTASLNGTLNLSLSNGFVPTVGSTFKIMDFNSETGTFTTVNGLSINSSEEFSVSYQGTDVLLTVVSTANAHNASRTVHSSSPHSGLLSGLHPVLTFGSQVPHQEGNTSSSGSLAGVRPVLTFGSQVPHQEGNTFSSGSLAGVKPVITFGSQVPHQELADSTSANATFRPVYQAFAAPVAATSPLSLASPAGSLGGHTAPVLMPPVLHIGTVAPSVFQTALSPRSTLLGANVFEAANVMGAATNFSHPAPSLSAAMNFTMPISYRQPSPSYATGLTSGMTSSHSSSAVSRLGARALTGGIFLPVTNLRSKPQVAFGVQ